MVRSKHVVMLNTLRNDVDFFTMHGIHDVDDGRYSEVVLRKFVTDRFGWQITVDVRRRTMWSIAVKKQGTDGSSPCRWLDMDRVSTWTPTANSVRSHLKDKLDKLQVLGLTLVDEVQQAVWPGDIVTVGKCGYFHLVVRDVRRVLTPYTPHGYTYIAVCSRRDSIGGSCIGLLYNVGGKQFRGEEHNHKDLVVIGNVMEGINEVPDSSISKS